MMGRFGDVVARGLALFLGGFTLCNVVGGLVRPGFDANIWWIDLRMLPAGLRSVVLLILVVPLLVYAWRPGMGDRWRRAVKWTAGILVVLVSLNVAVYAGVLIRGEVSAVFPVPFSAFMAVALGWVFWQVRRQRAGAESNTWTDRAGVAAVVGVCVVAFPLLQMVCYGWTDYRRQADVIVVFGARVYASGRLSDAVEQRVDEGIKLYREGRAPRMLMSGGPGDGAVHEVEAMRDYAVRQGVPREAILLDYKGLNTAATVANTREVCGGKARVLAVSHFYHLPRVRMQYARAGVTAYTVPVHADRMLRGLERNMMREVVALWVYYVMGEGVVEGGDSQ